MDFQELSEHFLRLIGRFRQESDGRAPTEKRKRPEYNPRFEPSSLNTRGTGSLSSARRNPAP